MAVDPEIERLVTALRLFGYSTVMSCGGHPDRRTTGPYVMLRSRSAGDEIERAEREDDDVKKQRHYRAARLLAQKEMLDLKRVVDQLNEDTEVASARCFLELRPSGHSGFRLCFVHSDFDELLEDAVYIETIHARRSVMDGLVLKLTNELGIAPELVQSS